MIHPTFPLQLLQFYFLHLIRLEFILISGVSWFFPLPIVPRLLLHNSSFPGQFETPPILPSLQILVTLFLHSVLNYCYYRRLITQFNIHQIKSPAARPLARLTYLSVFCVFILDVSLPISTC